MKNKKTSVLYDSKIYNIQRKGGINRYFSNLISRLPDRFYPYLTTFEGTDISEYPSHKNLTYLKHKRIKFRPIRLALQTEKLYACCREKYQFNTVKDLKTLQLAHPTWNTLLTHQSVNSYPCQVVITIHDMIQEIYPNLVNQSKQQIEDKKKAILAANSIICVSENTKNDLLNLYNIPEDKVFVTHLASELSTNISYGIEPIPIKPYFLFVGSRYSYKNFGTLLKAFAKLISVYPDITLCVVGSSFTPSEKKYISEQNLEDNINLYGQVDDAHLAKLYRCSIALVYPSLYEGFGLPPLEAMSCSTAVIASNNSSLPEVIGDAGILFDPREIMDLVDILLLLVDSPGERDRLILKGHQRVKLFDWNKTVKQTVDIYDNLVF